MTPLARTLLDDVAAAGFRGREATALRHPSTSGWRTASWDDLGREVRHACLGLGTLAVGRGTVVAVAVVDAGVRRVAELAVLAAGAAVAPLDPADPGLAGAVAAAGATAAIVDRPADLGSDVGTVVTVAGEHDVGDAPSTSAAWASVLDLGAQRDAAEPDRYEETWHAVVPADPAAVLVAAGDAVTFTHAALHEAARSFVRLVPVDDADRVLTTLSPTTVAGRLAWLLVPGHAGCEVTVSSIGALADGARGGAPTVVVADEAAWRVVLTDLAPAGGLGWRRRSARGRTEAGLAECRAAIVVGGAGAGSVATALNGAGVSAAAALAVPGVAGLVTMTDLGEPASGVGAPLPGVTVRTDDDGALHVRVGSAGASGWVDAGVRGRIDGGVVHLVVDGPVRAGTGGAS